VFRISIRGLGVLFGGSKPFVVTGWIDRLQTKYLNKKLAGRSIMWFVFVPATRQSHRPSASWAHRWMQSTACCRSEPPRNPSWWERCDATASASGLTGRRWRSDLDAHLCSWSGTSANGWKTTSMLGSLAFAWLTQTDINLFVFRNLIILKHLDAEDVSIVTNHLPTPCIIQATKNRNKKKWKNREQFRSGGYFTFTDDNVVTLSSGMLRVTQSNAGEVNLPETKTFKTSTTILCNGTASPLNPESVTDELHLIIACHKFYDPVAALVKHNCTVHTFNRLCLFSNFLMICAEPALSTSAPQFVESAMAAQRLR